MWTCRHCLEKFDFENRSLKANHSRWCYKNPDFENIRKKARDNTKKASEACVGRVVSEETRNLLSRNMLGKYKGKNNHFYGKKHSEKSKEKISQAARNSNHRRLVRSTREYITISGDIVLLDSSWEEELARQLDKVGIVWERPVCPIKWVDKNNQIRNYFPDFYLPEFNVYLDPKNSEAYKNQEEKINWLLDNRSDIIFLNTLKECKEFTGVRLMEKTTLF